MILAREYPYATYIQYNIQQIVYVYIFSIFHYLTWKYLTNFTVSVCIVTGIFQVSLLGADLGAGHSPPH